MQAAVFITKSGEVEGAALFYPESCSGRACTDDAGAMKLTILRDPAHPEVAALAHKWGNDEGAPFNDGHSFDQAGRVEIIDVASSHVRRR